MTEIPVPYTHLVTITDLGGFSLSFLVEAGYEDGATKTDSAGNVLETYDGSLKFEVTDMGTMTLHIGEMCIRDSR